jgi:carbon monoxide dehydrogenase subunit G
VFPGCQKLERVSDTVIETSIAAQIGPVKAPFGSRIELKDLDPPRTDPSDA